MENLFIIWTDKYATGLPILDEQYRGLVSLINSFFFHREDADKDIERVLVPTAEMFKAYARINFYTVEKLLEGAEYPNLENVAIQHQKILENIFRMDRRCRRARDAQHFLSYLKRYWMGTVRNLEAGYITFLRTHYAPEDAS